MRQCSRFDAEDAGVCAQRPAAVRPIVKGGGDSAARPRLEPLLLGQVLRGVAALLVLAGHMQAQVIAAASRHGDRLPGLRFPGGFGVDLFFCISGFIMVVSSKGLFGAPGARSTFLRRRAFRLVPLYWIATLCFVSMLLAGTHGYAGHLWEALLTSLLFLPYPTYGVDGSAVFPLYDLGWSLNYEVFFYVLFSLFIVLPLRRAVVGVCLSILAIAACGLAIAPQSTALRFWSQPIILEFAFGALIGWGWLRGLRFGVAARSAFVAAALAALALDPMGLTLKTGTTPNDLARVVGWGLPGVALLLAAVSNEESQARRNGVFDLLRHLGDCSYSLYLMHPFALIAIGKTWHALHVERLLGSWALALALVLGSIATAMFSCRCLERPVTRWLQDFTLPRRSVAA